MKIIEYKNAQKVPFDLEARILFSENNIEIILLTLKSEDELPSHPNPFDVVFLVLEGTGELTVEENSYLITKKSSVYVEKNKQRAWRNLSQEDLVIAVIKLLETS